MTHLDFLKKFKRFSPLDSSLSIVWFLFLTLCLFCSFLFLDYGGLRSRVGITWSHYASSFSPGPSVAFEPPPPSPSVSPRQGGEKGRDSGLGGGIIGGGIIGTSSGGAGNSSGGVRSAKRVGNCDYSDGKWVWDETYPLYESKDCPFMDSGFRCTENGRPDTQYTKWRWQPNNCNLPRFNAKVILERLRNRRVVFVGDSIGRNQWESLLCMLASAVPDKSSIYEVNGRPITKHMGYLVFRFRDYNCTIEYYRAPFLVVQGRGPAGAPKKVKLTLRVDTLEWNSPQWKGADVLVFNTGHWWNYEKTLRGGCYFQEGNEVKMNMSVQSAFRHSIKTLSTWVDKHVNLNKTRIFFRSYAPVHFSGGNWKTGGSCHMKTLPDLSISFSPKADSHFSIVNKVLSKHIYASKSTNFHLLNVTHMSAQRKDGHASVYYVGPKPAPLRRQDCSHWCLPGVPDTWNELLSAVLLKEDHLDKRYSTKGSQAEV